MNASEYVQWGKPAALNLLWVLPPLLALLYWHAYRLKRQALDTFIGAGLVPRLVPHLDWRRQRLRALLVVAAVALLIVAAARPRIGQGMELYESRGADLVVALDVSASMMAEDMQPSRLEAAKREVRGLLQMLKGDRVGLVIFSTRAHLICPLTMDYAAAQMFLDSIDERICTAGGTALRPALEQARKALRRAKEGQRVVVLVSDGEDWGPDATGAATELAKEGIRVYAVGIGTPEGAPVPAYDLITGERLGFKHTPDRQAAVSHLQEGALRQITKAGKGRYVLGGASDLGMGAIYRTLSGIEAQQARTYRFTTHVERFQWPLGFAVAMLALESLLATAAPAGAVASRQLPVVSKRQPSTRRPGTGSWRLGTGGCAALLVVLMSWLALSGFALFESATGLCAKGNRLYEKEKLDAALRCYERALALEPDHAVAEFNAGDALFGLADPEKALRRFQSAAQHAGGLLRGYAHYNAGNSYIQMQKLDEAIEAYKNALRINPDDSAAKYNLELAQRMKQQQQQQSQPQQDQQQQQNQQSQQPQPQPQQSDQPKQQPHPKELSAEQARQEFRDAQRQDARVRQQLTQQAVASEEGEQGLLLQSGGRDW